MDNDELKVLFSKNLNYWLERREKTQADLYKRMNVSSATASDWCNKKKIPRTDKLIEIAEWLMIELSDLLYQKDHVPNKLNDIIYKLKDEKVFYDIVDKLNQTDSVKYEKIKEYIDFLNR